ncbi:MULTISPECIES: hypothetical protein [Moorena]|nr:hypothetical protein [Moorena sp. SIO4G3]NEO80685.1 hypothetical protein [Moorena sp. SIO4G3]
MSLLVIGLSLSGSLGIREREGRWGDGEMGRWGDGESDERLVFHGA